jgi:CBS domain-containing protein
LLPAYPLDGGRVLRSALWQWKKNLRWATRIASQIGSVFAIVLIGIGVLFFLRGAVIGGVWWFIIGIFLRNASRMSYQQILMRSALQGETVRDFMKDPVTVPPSISVRQLVEDYVYKYHFKMFPIVKEGELVGCVSTRQIKEVPREQWDERTVLEIAHRCSRENTISPDSDAMKAMSAMSRTGNSRLMVVDGDKLIGIIALKDIIGFLSVKMDIDVFD